MADVRNIHKMGEAGGAQRYNDAAKHQEKNMAKGTSPSKLIDGRIKELGDWRGKVLAKVRALIKQAAPDVVEEWKWRGVPVWEHDGILCTGETYKSVVKLTFAKGAALADPSGLFNSSLDGNVRRAIDIREGEKINEKALKALIRAAVEANASKKSGAKAKKAKSTKAVKLLSGGNPQIAKGDGDASVQAYIAAIPEGRRDIGKRLDAIITKALPDVRKAVKWNSPFYGVEGQGWFLSFHVFTRYVKVGFFRGASLKPVPPGSSKDANMRYLDIHEGDRIDAAQLTKWVKQAAKIPGWMAK